MNANELADELDDIPVNDFESLDQHHYTRQAATMLRQQQAEIEALRKGLIPDDYVFLCVHCAKELKLFEGETNNEDQVD